MVSHLSKDKPIEVENIFSDNSINDHIVEKFEGKSRAYIEIQQGCDHQMYFLYNSFWQRQQ